VTDLPVLDLRDAGVRSSLGIAVGDLTGPRATAQALSPRAKQLGASGLVVPSAARADAWNLVVFPAAFGRLTIGRGRSMHPRPPGR
jgi:hypothetical protein